MNCKKNSENIMSDAKSVEDGLNRALAELYLLEIFLVSDCYIGEIAEILKTRSDGRLSIVSPYKIFYRLAESGYLIEKNKRIAPDGRLRLYYTITEAGRIYHSALLETYGKFLDGVKIFLNKKDNSHE